MNFPPFPDQLPPDPHVMLPESIRSLADLLNTLEAANHALYLFGSGKMPHTVQAEEMLRQIAKAYHHGFALAYHVEQAFARTHLVA